MTKTFEHNGFIITVTREPDEYGELDWLKQDYADCSPEEQAEYKAQDAARLEAYERGDWYLVRVGVEVQVKTATNWAVPPTVGRAYLHGIESDSEESYFLQTEAELLDEALTDARHTYEALSILFEQARSELC